PPHSVVTAWVLYALAHHRQPATHEEIENVLKRQGETGWWAMFPSFPDEAYASTSATAWTVLALHHQLKQDLIAPEQRDAVKAAVERSVRWLTRRAVVGAARWTEYPPEQIFERTINYLAASALVIHTLHVVAGSREFDNLWLDRLPQRVPSPIENEVAKGYVRSATQFTLDDVRHYPFPWMLRATIESYESGTTLQRARALLWLERAFNSPMRLEDFRAEYWTMAETLFALRQAQSLLDPKARPDALSQR